MKRKTKICIVLILTLISIGLIMALFITQYKETDYANNTKIFEKYYRVR